MCGIFGLINGKNNRYASLPICKVIAEAFVANSLRGMDSCGLFQVDKGKIYEYKKAVSGTEFYNDNSAEAYFRDADTAKVTICHNRAATHGAVSDANAHPFTAYKSNGNMLLAVHNGTLRDWDKHNANNAFSVDSEWAAWEIANDGADAFEKFNGAYAFVWYDQDDPDHVYIARNAQRPLFMVYLKGQNRMLLASEWQMMQWLLERNNLSVDEVVDVTPGRMYKVSIDNPRSFTSTILPTPAANPVVQRTSQNWKDEWDDIPWQGRSNASYVNGLVDAILSATKELVPTATPKEVDKSSHSRTPLGPTTEEVRLAKAADSFGASVTFKPELYEADTKELWGTIKFEDGTSSAAVIYGVPKDAYDTYKTIRAGLVCSVVGARRISARDSIDELTYILSRTVSAANAVENDALREGLARALAQKTNSNAVH